MTTTVTGDDYQAGYAYGFADNQIRYWNRCRYSAEFMRGYDVGKAEIDRLVEEADEYNHNGIKY